MHNNNIQPQRLLKTPDFHFAYPALDPCLHGNNKPIDEPHRSALFQPESTDGKICDRNLTEGNML